MGIALDDLSVGLLFKVVRPKSDRGSNFASHPPGSGHFCTFIAKDILNCSFSRFADLSVVRPINHSVDFLAVFFDVESYLLIPVAVRHHLNLR